MVPTAASAGLKVFIQSPYDCVLAVKRDLADHLDYLCEHQRYKEAWELVEEHPEVITSHAERLQGDESPSTPSQARQSLADFFADEDQSQATTSGRGFHSAVEKEKRRIGEQWLQQLVNAGDWTEAGQTAGKVLGTSSRWEHWVWAFAQAGRFDEITPYIPTKQLQPPLPSDVYTVVLGHYIHNDRLRLKELLESWDPELFEIKSVTSAIESMLDSGDVREDTVENDAKGRDWRILLDALARLYVADNRPKDGLRCYIRLQNADAAMSLIREFQLLSAISDDIPGFVLLRVSKEQLDAAPLSELEDASSEAIRLLVDEAFQGMVMPQTVVEQLQYKDLHLQPFLFLYFRSLWNAEGMMKKATNQKGLRGAERLENEGRALVEDFGDLAVELFAEYDRDLLMKLLKGSERYDYEHACSICETRQYIPELVYLLSKTGQMKRALFLIIDRLGDVSQAIKFAKDANDQDLWNDLLDYSMDKPPFIRGLLNEIGTSINPLKLVRRIPEGLEIEGLRDGIRRMVREYQVQDSISEGVAKVLRGEVDASMDVLRKGQKKGVKFEVKHHEMPPEVDILAKPVKSAEESQEEVVAVPQKEQVVDVQAEPGHCVGCGEVFVQNGERTFLIVVHNPIHIY